MKANKIMGDNRKGVYKNIPNSPINEPAGKLTEQEILLLQMSVQRKLMEALLKSLR